ncbi:hypothetical protein BJY00DRAFT_64215 [Aspergillus carlsbadensis]|nr:hypothetical protein BJY00DRAFT_64215 [Aspergillus carlsbadensis]
MDLHAYHPKRGVMPRFAGQLRRWERHFRYGPPPSCTGVSQLRSKISRPYRLCRLKTSTPPRCQVAFSPNRSPTDPAQQPLPSIAHQQSRAACFVQRVSFTTLPLSSPHTRAGQPRSPHTQRVVRKAPQMVTQSGRQCGIRPISVDGPGIHSGQGG